MIRRAREIMNSGASRFPSSERRGGAELREQEAHPERQVAGDGHEAGAVPGPEPGLAVGNHPVLITLGARPRDPRDGRSAKARFPERLQSGPHNMRTSCTTGPIARFPSGATVPFGRDPPMSRSVDPEARSSVMDGRVAKAEHLRSLHVPGRPLVLPNAWDPASAGAVEAAGFLAVATASTPSPRASAIAMEKGRPSTRCSPRWRGSSK